MDMSFSYKPVLIQAMPRHTRTLGIIPVDESVWMWLAEREGGDRAEL